MPCHAMIQHSCCDDAPGFLGSILSKAIKLRLPNDDHFFDRYKDIRMVTTNLTPHHDAKLVNIQYIIFTTYYIDLYRHDHHYPICAGQSD